MRVASLLALGLAAWSPIVQADATDEIVSFARRRIRQESDARFHEGDFPLVVRLLQFEARLAPSDQEAASTLVWMLGNVENHAGALAEAVRFQRQNPTDPDATYTLAEWLYRKRAYARMPALLEPSIAATPPPHPNTFRFLAHSYDRMGYYEDSVRVWDALLRLTPDDEAARAHRARVAARRDQASETNETG